MAQSREELEQQKLSGEVEKLGKECVKLDEETAKLRNDLSRFDQDREKLLAEIRHLRLQPKLQGLTPLVMFISLLVTFGFTVRAGCSEKAEVENLRREMLRTHQEREIGEREKQIKGLQATEADLRKKLDERLIELTNAQRDKDKMTQLAQAKRQELEVAKKEFVALSDPIRDVLTYLGSGDAAQKCAEKWPGLDTEYCLCLIQALEDELSRAARD